MSTTTAIPLSRAQAMQIAANPGAYADRPILVALARMVAASAAGEIVTQRRFSRRFAKPALRVIDGGRTRHTGPEAA